ncbi:MAG: DNA polymerase III subunit delta' [Gallionellaceae bacterium]|nr:DNA polymerase III subunit delta' [Gallionellaceae bacterium]
MWQSWRKLRERSPHALLLKGSQGIGKLDFAMNLAQSLLCEQPKSDGFACGECASCHWFAQGTHPDFRLIQPEILAESDEDDDREGGKKKKPSRVVIVDQIRELADFVSLSAHQGGYRVAVIHPAEAMNANSMNALLKTLEEPSGRNGSVLLVLVSHKPQRLLPTILSRCLSLSMPLPPVEESIAWLKEQGVDDPERLLVQTGFAPLSALALAEQDSGEEYARFMKEIASPARLDALGLAERLQGQEPATVVHWLQQWCYDLGSLKLGGEVRYNAALRDSIQKIAGKINAYDLLRYQRELMVARREAAHPLNTKLLFESLLLSYRQLASA